MQMHTKQHLELTNQLPTGKASLQDKTGTIELVSGFTLDGTDDSSSNAGDFIVLNTSADDGDRLLFEDGTSDPIAVLASME